MLILISIFHLGAKPSIRVVSHKYKSSRARKKLACKTMLLEMQSKQISLTIYPKQKQFIFCAQHIMARSEAGSFFPPPPKGRVIISSRSLLIQSSRCTVFLCFLTALFRWVVHCSLSHVYWPKPQCEIQNNCSPQLPWHSLAHCAGLFSSSRKSSWDRIFPKIN